MMEGRVIEYRPLGGGLDYHNSPLIGEIATNDLYHTHRSIDQLRSLNDRDALTNGHPPPTITDLKTSILQLDYKNYNNNAGEIRSHQQQHPHHGQHHHHHHHQQHQQQQHHDDVEYMKHVAEMNGATGTNVDQNGTVNENGGHTVITTDGNILIEEQSDKMEMVLKQVEKHEVDSVYHASASGTPSPPLASPPEPTERVGRGRKKVQNLFGMRC